MQLMVEEMCRRGYFAAAATYSQEWFGHVNDIHLNLNLSKSRVRKYLSTLLFSVWGGKYYDIFHFFPGRILNLAKEVDIIHYQWSSHYLN
jgi:hypothetical protein